MDFIEEVWPYNRSLTGAGTQKTLLAIRERLPDLEIIQVPSGSKCWDWTVPKVWNLEEGYIMDSEGRKVVSSNSNNLHVASYSNPVDCLLTLDELKEYIFTKPDLPDAIPYRTKYYDNSWAFCMSENQKNKLTDQKYRVVINSSLEEGFLEYGQLKVQGKSENEIIFSTYVCHPSLANNELSGPAVGIGIGSFLSKLNSYYSYRILFVPETIGTLAFLSTNFDELKKKFVSGHILTCLGDDRMWSFLPSLTGIEMCDVMAKRVLVNSKINYVQYPFLERGSDERQYCSPLINLPVSSVMRSKYGVYPEYHTSLDNLTLISESALKDSLKFYEDLILEYERNRIPIARVYGEPMLSKRSLRNPTGGGTLSIGEIAISQILAYADGRHDTKELSRMLGISSDDLKDILELCLQHELIEFR